MTKEEREAEVGALVAEAALRSTDAVGAALLVVLYEDGGVVTKTAHLTHTPWVQKRVDALYQDIIDGACARALAAQNKGE